MIDIGLQLYSVRDAMKESLPNTLKEVAKMGYKQVEFAGYYNYSANDIAKILADNGLSAIGSHTGLDDLSAGKINATLDFNQEIGNKNIVIPSAPWSSKKAQASTFEGINKAQPIVEKAGMKLSYHNHSHEFEKKFFTPVFYPELMEKTKIGLEIDTFWAFNAGLDPVNMMEKLNARLNLIHIKDGFRRGILFKPARGMSLGSGEAPVREVLAKAIELNIPVIVESENQKPDGLSEVKRCIDFLKSL